MTTTSGDGHVTYDVNQTDRLVPIPAGATADSTDGSFVGLLMRSFLQGVPADDVAAGLRMCPDELLVGAQMLAQGAAHLLSDERRRRGDCDPEQTC